MPATPPFGHAVIFLSYGSGQDDRWRFCLPADCPVDYHLNTVSATALFGAIRDITEHRVDSDSTLSLRLRHPQFRAAIDHAESAGSLPAHEAAALRAASQDWQNTPHSAVLFHAWLLK